MTEEVEHMHTEDAKAGGARTPKASAGTGATPSPVRRRWAGMLALSGLLWAQLALADDKPVYRCPGNLYTDAISAKEAKEKGCKTLDGAPITVIQSPVFHSSHAAAPAGSAASKVDSGDQKARDSDARRILQAELQKQQSELNDLQTQYNNGQPERQGNERNYQKYLDRVQDMKDQIARKEDDIAALKRELGGLGSAP